MLQYEINNKIKRNGRLEVVLMEKYVVSPVELEGIMRFLSNSQNLQKDVVNNVQVAIKRTERIYERKYAYDPEAPLNSRTFILFKSDAMWLQEYCLNKLFTTIK